MMKYFIATTSGFLFAALAGPVFAASISIQGTSTIAATLPAAISVILESSDQYTNAVEGTIQVPENFTIESLRDARSVVSVWLEHPEAKGKSIRFSGIIPGGYQGREGILFELYGYFEREGTEEFSIQDGVVYKSDGTGSGASSSPATLRVVVSPGTGTHEAFNKTDNFPPELFTPEVTRSEGVFANQWFVVFQATDKQSGIKGYEVAEVSPWWPFRKKWEAAESPHLLHDQLRQMFIYVKAKDNEGNELVVKLYPENKRALYLSEGIVGILILFILGLALVSLRRLGNGRKFFRREAQP